LEVLGTPKTLDNYVVLLSQPGVTGITSTCDPAQRDRLRESAAGPIGLLHLELNLHPDLPPGAGHKGRVEQCLSRLG
jgi:hypothetical protein